MKAVHSHVFTFNCMAINKNTWPLFVFHFQDNLASGQNCRVMQFHSPTVNRSLSHHVIGNVWVTSEIACESACFAEDDCMSVNFGPQNPDGKHLCELSGSDQDISPKDLRQKKGFVYKAVEVRWAKRINERNKT